MSFGHAIKWAFLSEVASKAVSPLVFVILARLLTPEDYGVVAAASMVMSFSQIFWEAGMGKTIIQYQGDRKAAANTAFWINIALGFLVAGGLVAISGVVSDKVFHDPRVAAVLKVMAFQVFFSASAAVHTALLQKDMRFKHLFWIRLGTVAVPGLVSIPLALFGLGYWALVCGSLAGQMVQVSILWKTSPWKPHFGFDPAVAKKLVRFGGWVAASGLLAWFFVWADSLIVGMHLGAHELGLYRTGNNFVMMLYGFLFGPLLPVLYSYFSGIQHDRERVKAVLFRTIKIITFVSLPLALFICANSSFIANTVFGAKWEGVGLVIAVLALMHGYSWVVGTNGEAYRAVGFPSYETTIMAVTLPFYVAGYWLSVRHSFETFLWTRFGLSLAAWVVHFWVARKAVNLQIFPCIAYVLKITLVCLPAMLVAWLSHTGDTFVSGVVRAGVIAFFMACALLLLERKGLVPELFTMIKRKTGA